MNGEIRTERRVGVTSNVTPSAAQNLYVLAHSQTWPDLLDVLERCCIEVETILINTDPADKQKVLENHKLAKAAWIMFERMQNHIAEAGTFYLQGVAKQPVIPRLTEEEMERDNMLNPTLYPPEPVDGDDGQGATQ